MKKFIVFALTITLISMGSYLKAQSQEEEALKLKEKAAELVTEIKTLITEGKSAQVKAKVLEYAKAISGIQGRLQDLETDTLQTVIDATTKHLGVLNEVYDSVPEEAKEAIALAIEVSIRGSEEAEKNLRERSITQERATFRGFGFTDEDGDGVNDFSLRKWENRFYGLQKRMEHQYNWQHLNPVAGLLKAGNIPGLSLRPEFSLDMGRNKDRRTPPVTPPVTPPKGPPKGKN